MPKRGLPAQRLVPILLVLVSLAVASAAGPPGAHAGLPPDAPPTPTPPAPDRPLEHALQAALGAYVRRFAPGTAFRLGRVRQAGPWAYAVAQQPGQERFVALLAHHGGPEGWRVLAPGLTPPAEYNALLDRFPDAMLDEGSKAFLRLPEAALAGFTGHRLPWPAGQFAYVMQIDVEPYHMSQVDFDILGLQAAGDVVATRPGMVVFVKESSNSGACDDPSAHGKGNLVVIQHGPEEYSWYLHLAYQSVPVAVGDWVDFGSKIGVEGNTGYACGVHLHYMASMGHTGWTDPNDPGVSPWATGITAVDFEEAAWSDLVVMETYTSTNELLLLEVVGPLSFSPAQLSSTGPVTAGFRLRNAGSQPVSLQQVAALVRGPGCASWDCSNQADFPASEGVTLEPGEEYAYHQQRAFPEPGAYLARPAWQEAGGAWHLASGEPVGFLVGLEPRSYLPLALVGG